MSTALLDIRGVSIHYGDHTALEEITLSLPEASFLAVVGPNGSGKSTLLRSVLGLVAPSSGTINVFGSAPGTHPEWIGYVPQIKRLSQRFPGIVMELVVSGIRRGWPFWIRKREEQAALAALEKTGAAHLAHRPLFNLSGGELQRVYLARSIIHNPKLILLDEPTTGIDIGGETDLLRLLDSIKKSVAIIMVTHDLQTAFHHADFVLLLNRTQIGFGRPDECMSSDCLSRAFGHAGHSHPGFRGFVGG